MAAILGTLTAIFTAIPVLKSWWDQIVALYVAQQYAAMLEGDRAAISQAVQTHDQRPIETAINSSKAGIPSGVSEPTQRRDTLPGV